MGALVFLDCLSFSLSFFLQTIRFLYARFFKMTLYSLKNGLNSINCREWNISIFITTIVLDDYSSVLKQYIETGQITLVEWPYTFESKNCSEWNKIQNDAYNDCLNRFGDQTHWLAVIDTDEFLFCPDGTPLPNFLKGYEKFGGLCVNWMQFGTSDVDEIPPGDLIIHHLVHWGYTFTDWDKKIKSIIQPKYVEACLDPHFFSIKKAGLLLMPSSEK